jgi:hypothetical protein
MVREESHPLLLILNPQIQYTRKILSEVTGRCFRRKECLCLFFPIESAMSSSCDRKAMSKSFRALIFWARFLSLILVIMGDLARSLSWPPGFRAPAASVGKRNTVVYTVSIRLLSQGDGAAAVRTLWRDRRRKRTRRSSNIEHALTVTD